MTRGYTHSNIHRYLFTITINGLVRGVRITDIPGLVTHTNRQQTNYFCMVLYKKITV